MSVELSGEKEYNYLRIEKIITLRNSKMIVVVCVAITRCHTYTEVFGIPELRGAGLASFTGAEHGGECVLYHVQPCGATVIHVVRE